jgi:UPF0716 family protein affecting phage T7 exclusion
LLAIPGVLLAIPGVLLAIPGVLLAIPGISREMLHVSVGLTRQRARLSPCLRQMPRQENLDFRRPQMAPDRLVDGEGNDRGGLGGKFDPNHRERGISRQRTVDRGARRMGRGERK